MADVLMVSALELSHPVLFFILVIADDAFFHAGRQVLHLRALGNGFADRWRAARSEATGKKRGVRLSGIPRWWLQRLSSTER
jgi:hypothetical protein